MGLALEKPSNGGTGPPEGHWPADQPFTAETLQALLAERIHRLDVHSARLDIERFVADAAALEIWSPSYFHSLVQRIQVV